MKRLDILWLSHLVPYPPKGGILQRSYNLLFELSRYNNVHLVSFIQPDLIESHFDEYQLGIDTCKRELGRFCTTVSLVSIPAENVNRGRLKLALTSLLSPTGFSIDWLKSKQFESQLKILRDQNQYDVVHFDTLALAQYKHVFPDVRSILDHHNIESHMMIRRSSQETNIFKKFYFLIEGIKLKRYERRVCGQFSLNITCSDLDKDRLYDVVKTENIKISTVPNGVDLNYFSPISKKFEKDHPVIIFAGGLSWYPNIAAVNFFINEVWQELRKAIPSIKFYVVGRNPPQALLSVAQNDPNLVVTGFVDDIREYFNKADLYICPIRDGGGTKLKILDALAVGFPLVSHPVACEGIEVTENEDVLFATSSAEWVAQIKKLVVNEELREQLRINAPKLIQKKYSYNAIGKLFDDQIRELV